MDQPVKTRKPKVKRYTGTLRGLPVTAEMETAVRAIAKRKKISVCEYQRRALALAVSQDNQEDTQFER